MVVRLRWIAASLAISATCLAMLFSAAAAFAADGFHTVPVAVIEGSGSAGSGGWSGSWQSSGGIINTAINGSGSGGKIMNTPMLIPVPPTYTAGLVLDIEVQYTGSRPDGTFIVRLLKGPDYNESHQVLQVIGPAPAAGSVRFCTGSADLGQFAGLNCDVVGIGAWWNDGLAVQSNVSSNSSSGNSSIYNIRWIMPGPPPSTDDFLAGFCTFTTTLTITDSLGVTSTQQVSYTRPVNRLRNHSFEQQSGPGQTSGWQSVVNGIHTHVPGHWFQLPGLARTGSGVVYNEQHYELWQSMAIYTTGLYVMGFHATGPGVVGKWNGAPIANSATVEEGYQVFSGTYPAGAGGGIYVILSFDGGPPTYVDDAFAYYTDDPETLAPLCVPSAFEPFDEGSWGDTGGVGGIPTPIGGAGAVCYNCIPPTDINPGAISYWIAWLGCVLRNMFSCSLRVWLLAVGNWTNGVIQYFRAFAIWVPLTGQQAANWFMGSVVPGIGGVAIINEGSNMLDLLIAIIGLIGTMIQALSNVLLGIVNLVTSLLELIPAAFSADPFEFEFAGGSPGGGVGSPGPNDDKRLYAFFLFMGLIDQVVVGHAEVTPLLLMAMGALTLGVIFWVGYFWRDVIHI